jgi:molecular chaperone DnaK (HSP70)
MTHDGPIVGIDLGTTFSAIASLDAEGRPVILSVAGARVTPSVVSYPVGEGAPLVGVPALNQLAYAPERTVRSAKRRMGSGERYVVGERTLAATEVQAEVLRHLADGAAAALGARPTRAVITVPAYFDQPQRQATREAGERAGLAVERLLNEPTAAALARYPEGGLRQLLVYDFGGGTFDASVVRQESELLEVLASHGDTHLGGDDLDRALADLLLERWAAQRGADAATLARRVRADLAASTRLDLAAEAAKRQLSDAVDAVVRLEYLLEGAHLEVEVTRHDFEGCLAPFLERTLASVRRALDDARLGPDDLDEVLLVGGSSRIPAVWERLHEELGLEPDRSLHPEESVALGAAVQAGLASGAAVRRVLVDVAPYSLGVAALQLSADPPFMRCKVVTPRNTPIPSRCSEVFYAISADQKGVEVFVFQGSDEDPLRNRCIGRLHLSGIARAPGEQTPRVTVDFQYDLDGIVGVTLSNRAAQRSESAKLAVDGLGTRDLAAEYLASCLHARHAPGPGRSLAEAQREWVAALEREKREKEGAGTGEGTEEDDALEAAAALAAALGGDDADEDDYEDEGAPRREPAAPQGHPQEEGGPPAPLAEDYRTLKRIMGRFPELQQRHPAEAQTLRRLLEEAREAMRARPLDAAAAEAAYDRLTDLLFDLGEFF